MEEGIRQVLGQSGGVQMKLAFTIHWYGGVSAGLPITQDTYIADIPDNLLPTVVQSQLAGKNYDAVMTLSIVRVDK